MSSIAHSPAAPVHHADNKFGLFVQIAFLLAFLTGVEIVVVYMKFPRWTIVSALVVLSIVKFMYVIFVFMHLKWDKLFCTILFFIGLILAVATVWALLALFGSADSAAVGQVVWAGQALAGVSA